MKATVDAAAFAKAVKAAGSFIGATHLAALSMIRIAATEDSLELVAGNLEHWVSIDVDAEVSDAGTVLVAAHSLAQVAGHFAGTVDLVAEDDALRLLGGDRQAEFRCGDLTAYPIVEWPDTDPVPLGDAWPRLRRILHAASRDGDKQAAVRSVMMLQADGTAVCTDSYRLAWCDFPAPVEDLLVPIDGVERVARLLGDEVSMAVGDSNVAWSTASMTIMSRLVVGQVPNWRGLLRPVPHSFEVDAAELVDALAMVSALNDKTSSHIRLRFVDGRLELGRTVQDVGVTRAEVDVVGEWPFKMGVNPRYLAEAVRAAQAGGAERVTLSADSANKAFRIVGGDIEQLLMPVSLAGAR